MLFPTLAADCCGGDDEMRQTRMDETRSTIKRAPSGDELRQPSFTASRELADALQQVHVDLIELHVQGKQAHWNVVGKNFRDLHLQLDEIVDAARGFSDAVAERMRAVYITPDGRSATVAEKTSLPPFPEGEVDTGDTVDLHPADVRRDLHDARRARHRRRR